MNKRELWNKVLGHLFIASSSSYLFNKIDFEQYLLKFGLKVQVQVCILVTNYINYEISSCWQNIAKTIINMFTVGGVVKSNVDIYKLTSVGYVILY